MPSTGTRAHAFTPAPIAGRASGSSGQRGRTGDIEAIGQAERQPLGTRPGDHRRVVGAQAQGRRVKVKPRRSRKLAPGRAQRSLAATPPATTKLPRRAVPSRVRRDSMARAHAIGDALRHRRLERRRRGRRHPARFSGASASAVRRTAVFRPANEKCGSSRPSIGRGRSKRPGSPVRAACSTAGPPGKPSPRSFAVLSKASPSASSMVVPRRRSRRRRARPEAAYARPRPAAADRAAAGPRSGRRSARGLQMVDRDQRLAGAPAPAPCR